jgi:hypothetical protein
MGRIMFQRRMEMIRSVLSGSDTGPVTVSPADTIGTLLTIAILKD